MDTEKPEETKCPRCGGVFFIQTYQSSLIENEPICHGCALGEALLTVLARKLPSGTDKMLSNLAGRRK